MITLIRVDDRLIHGQVAVGWCKAVNASQIMVIDDIVAKDEAQKLIMKLAAPQNVDVYILTFNEAIRQIETFKKSKNNALILVRDPKVLVDLINNGFKIDKVNVGNVRMRSDRVRLTKEVAATKDEILSWKELDKLGVKLEAQWLPGGAITNFNNIIRKL